jgi:hypothetical protein
MLDVHDLRVGNILALIGEEMIASAPVVAIDEIGLVHLEGMDYPENIENMVGVPFHLGFFVEKTEVVNSAQKSGMVILPFMKSESIIHSVNIEFHGTFIKECFFIHELQNTMIDLIGIDPYALLST